MKKRDSARKPQTDADRAPPSRPCGCCFGLSFWKRREAKTEWFCSRCHPPVVEEASVERLEVAGSVRRDFWPDEDCK